jgi:outer membrane murein-binding lipoprotein Lpp
METPKAKSFKMTPSVRKEIVAIIDARIREAHVTKEDFSELKGIVKELGVKVGKLADAQARTELRVEELAGSVQELAAAQKRTELRVEELAGSVQELAAVQKRTELRVEELAGSVQELAAAQKRTEIRVEELAEAQKRTEIEVRKLAEGLNETRGELGGLSRSMSYAFENESYRFLPEVLKAKYGIQVKEKIVRAEIGGKEINIFCRAQKNGHDVFIVGEAKLRLDERKDVKYRDVIEELEDKVKAVMAEYGEIEVARVLVTHYATKGFVNRANERGIIIVQSYEW